MEWLLTVNAAVVSAAPAPPASLGVMRIFTMESFTFPMSLPLSQTKVCGTPVKLEVRPVVPSSWPETAVAVLPRFAPTLKRLSLSRVPLSPAAMKSIGELAHLDSLELSGCSLTDESIRPIANLKDLATLDLSGNFGVTDKSATLLRALSRLKHVDTTRSGMTSP